MLDMGKAGKNWLEERAKNKRETCGLRGLVFCAVQHLNPLYLRIGCAPAAQGHPDALPPIPLWLSLIDKRGL